MKAKILYLFFITLIFFSCKSNTNSSYELYLKRKTFLRLTDTENGDVLFLSCAANLPKLRFTNTFYKDVGQEQTEFDNWHIKSDTNNTLKIVYFTDNNREESSSIRFDTLNKIIQYNGYRYMDSIHAVKLPYIIEECEKCNEITLCDEWKKNGEWKNFIISQLPLEFIPKDELVKINSTVFDKDFFKQWQGTYNFSLEGLEHMGESHSISYSFIINDNSKIISQLNDEPKQEIACTIFKTTQDTLVIQTKGANQNEYNLFKDSKGDYYIGGDAIYMLNPPNESYPLIKQ